MEVDDAFLLPPLHQMISGLDPLTTPVKGSPRSFIPQRRSWPGTHVCLSEVYTPYFEL